ncbi:MAG: hypothetical protein JXR58_13880 [Bacteroidales bacterium]|nr:hypothetical protein [Bacteroidales bacterium]
MIRLTLIITGILIHSFGLYAHEEPAKTIKEKEKKEQDRKEIQENKIVSFTVWKHNISDNKQDTVLKEKFLIVSYNTKGNISEMQIYKSNDTLDYKVVFGYDGNNNMITDTDYNPDGTIAENIEYKYDGFGRVLEQFNFTEDGKLDSKFTYVTDNNSKTVTLNKYKPTDSVEYQIIYKYAGSIDNGNDVEIIKQKPNGELIMRVENVFDENNHRLQKKIFDENNQLMYYFEYTYFGNGDKFSTITKYSPDNQIKSKTIYTLNEIGFTDTVKIVDESGNVLSFSNYEYKFEK